MAIANQHRQKPEEKIEKPKVNIEKKKK